MTAGEEPGRARRWATLVAAAAIAVVMIPLMAAPAGAAGLSRQVSDADMTSYCRSVGYSSAVLVGNDAYGWRCSGPYGSGGVDMDRLCSKFSQDGPFARVGNFYDPRSWQCWGSYSQVSNVTSADFSAYCRKIGYSGAVVGRNAYSWLCTAPNRQTTFRVVDVCYTKTPRAGLVDRFRNFYDPYSWECRR